MESALDLLGTFRLADLADLLVVAVLFGVGITWLRTTRARPALVGVAILGAVYLVAREVGMVLTAWILQGFAAVSVLVLVVVFQEEIRRLFEQIAMLGLRRRPLAEVVDAVDTLTRALAQLATQKRGALVVIPGREPPERHLDGGILLDARISEPLLLSLFDPNSAGHDGAVVLAGDRAKAFAVHLPLSTNHAELGTRGTRHAAGLGLSERCDALCLVVSEERGSLSVARAGKLRTLARPELVGDEIRGFLAELAPTETHRSGLRALAGRWREAGVALALAGVVWVLAVPVSGNAEVERSVPVEIFDLPEGYALESVDPPEVQVLLSGNRRDLLVLAPEMVAVRVNTTLVELGRRTFRVGPSQVSHPPRTEVLAVSPDTVKISLRPIAGSE